MAEAVPAAGCARGRVAAVDRPFESRAATPASAEVLSASIPGLDISTARQWVNERSNHPWESLEEMRKRMGPLALNLSEKRHSVNTRYFEIVGQMRLDSVVLLERSLVQREGIVSKTVWRERRPLHAEPGCISTIAPPC